MTEYTKVKEVLNLLKEAKAPSQLRYAPLSNRNFYKSREEHNEGSYSRFMVPQPEYLPQALTYYMENGIETVGDFVKHLNKMGYNKGYSSELYHKGITFNTATWEWSSSESPDTPIVTACVKESDSSSKLVFENSGTFYGALGWSVHLRYEVDCSAPDWMCEKQGYKFVPEEVMFKHLPREIAGGNTLYFGMEFEIVTSMQLREIQRVVCDVEPTQEPFFYFKHDGSIDPYSGDESPLETPVEIVTLPCTPKFLRKNLRTFFSKLAKLGLLGQFQTNKSCGVHVHLSKDAFYSGFHKKKFVTIWNQFEPTSKRFIQKLGKRAFTSYCKNADAHSGLILSRRLKKSIFANGHDVDKYSASRETNHTVEVRVFKGEFSLDHILYCLDVCRAMFAYADKVPLSDLKGSSFSRNFLSWLRSHPYFNSLKKELL